MPRIIESIDLRLALRGCIDPDAVDKRDVRDALHAAVVLTPEQVKMAVLDALRDTLR